MKTKKLLLFLCCTSIIVLLSCKKEKKFRDESFEKIDFSELTDEIKKEYYSFPSPEEMFKYIDSFDISFNPELLHSIDFVDNYISSEDKATNLGVYIADLAYITLFKKYNESVKYLQAIYKLCDKLRISSAYDKNFYERINNNIKNFDSLKVIGDEAYTILTNYLTKSSKEQIFAMISLGGFIEFLYISLNLCDKYDENNPVVKKVFDQKAVLSNIYNFAIQFKNDSAVNRSIRVVDPLYEFYNNLPMIGEKTRVNKTSGGILKFSGGKQIVFNEKDFFKMKNLINEIRFKIINGKIE